MERHRFIRFVAVGVSNTAITLCVYWITLDLGLDYLAAGAVGYAAGILNGYVWSHNWVFQADGSFALVTFRRYLCVQLTGLILNTALLNAAVEWLGIPHAPAEAAVLVPVVAVTYFLNARWTFRPESATELDAGR
jgi:putative flippase GtrA